MEKFALESFPKTLSKVHFTCCATDLLFVVLLVTQTLLWFISQLLQLKPWNSETEVCAWEREERVLGEGSNLCCQWGKDGQKGEERLIKFSGQVLLPPGLMEMSCLSWTSLSTGALMYWWEVTVIYWSMTGWVAVVLGISVAHLDDLPLATERESSY